MMEIIFLTTEQVINLQRVTLPNSGTPNLDRLEGALNRVQTLHHYENCDDVFSLAAMYLVGIAKAHAFNDANKRTAFQAASIFLMMNGFELDASYHLVKTTVLAAESDATVQETAYALRLLSNYREDLMDGYEGDYL
ncbi:type II toxin-antitoxin system death-on-curing family toxin [Nissabacter sp. SGAir0207]|uniref:type II toxin-antitoxin system death-on-curing family toxin n=1 Tax=Nissabacter sp. SGAir0207 TaxID=2126321 RepID=UPI0010CD1582|nr:type II toxin-antitoxin system death-on-curing family toxin [Nissabacter sp. SGAir0207]QCR38756.1 type II toxin-antitoxin system death-on-curing family toxin [Nissabacter sp. SGAir0207]